MKKIVLTILTICLLLVSSVSFVFADIGYNPGTSTSTIYSDSYTITCENYSQGFTLDDVGGGPQIYPSLRFGTSNSVVNALYNGANLTLRKSTQCVNNTIVDGEGRASFYTTYTNLTNVDGYSVTLHFPIFNVGDLVEVAKSIYLYTAFSGSVQECYYSYRYPVFAIEPYCTDEITEMTFYSYLSSEPREGVVYDIVGRDSGNLIDEEMRAQIESDVALQYTSVNDALIYDLTFELYVENPTTNRTVSYTIGQEFRAYNTLYPTIQIYEEVNNVAMPNLFEWLSDVGDSFFAIKIYGGITIGTVFMSCLGLLLVRLFLHYFAGG